MLPKILTTVFRTKSLPVALRGGGDVLLQGRQGASGAFVLFAQANSEETAFCCCELFCGPNRNRAELTTWLTCDLTEHNSSQQNLCEYMCRSRSAFSLNIFVTILMCQIGIC